MSAPIRDEFSNLPISRQRKYQLRKEAAGLCRQCGVEAIGDWVLCPGCLDKHKVRVREWQRQHFGYKERYYGAKSYGKEKPLTDSRSQE